jgi:hypothetical protein
MPRQMCVFGATPGRCSVSRGDGKLSESDSDGVEEGVSHSRGHARRAELDDPSGR